MVTCRVIRRVNKTSCGQSGRKEGGFGSLYGKCQLPVGPNIHAKEMLALRCVEEWDTAGYDPATQRKYVQLGA